MKARAGAREVRVVLADEHSSTRAGVRMALEGHGFTVVAEASTRTEAVAAALRERPGLCLLDADLPGGGVSAAFEIAAETPEATVVMLAATAEDNDVLDALAAGAEGYLLKDMDSRRLPHALHGVLAGEAALPRALVTRLIEEFRIRRRRRESPALARLGVALTEREWEILEMLRAGHPTRAIAERLGISPVTVRRHISELLRKLNAPTRAAAVALLDE